MAKGVSLLLPPTYRSSNRAKSAAAAAPSSGASNSASNNSGGGGKGSKPATLSALGQIQASGRLASATLRAILTMLASRQSLLQALTPDALTGAAKASATAATLDSAPFPSGQNSAFSNVNGAFSQTTTTPATPFGYVAPATPAASAPQSAEAGAVTTLTGLSLSSTGDIGGEYAVTLNATNGTLGLPSSSSRGSSVQLIGTLAQINNTLQSVNFQGTNPGTATIAVTDVSLGGLSVGLSGGNPSTSVEVTAAAPAATPAPASPAPASPAPASPAPAAAPAPAPAAASASTLPQGGSAIGGALQVKGIDSTTHGGDAQSNVVLDDLFRGDQVTALRGFAVDGGTGPVTATLTVKNGTASVTAVGGATVTQSSQNGDTTLTITGSQDDINSTLYSLQAKGGAVGSRSSITLTATDGTTSKSVTTYLRSVDGGSLAVTSARQSYNVSMAFDRTAAVGEVTGVAGFAVNSISDTGGNYVVTLAVNGGYDESHGTIAIGGGPRGATVQVSGTLSEVNTALQSLNYLSGSSSYASIAIQSVSVNGTDASLMFGIKNILSSAIFVGGPPPAPAPAPTPGPLPSGATATPTNNAGGLHWTILSLPTNSPSPVS